MSSTVTKVKPGPRRLVLQNLAQQTQGLQLGADATTVAPGNVNLSSFSVPGLAAGSTYKAKFTQSINFATSDSNVPATLVSEKDFTVAGSPYSLDSSLVNSVYPPSGHSDYWNVLPHILFNDEKVPWMFEGTPKDTLQNPTPWLALLTFTESELTLSSDQLTAVNGVLGIPSATVDALPKTPTFACNLQLKDLVALNGTVSQPVPLASGADPTPIQAIFLQPSLFSNLFGAYKSGTSTIDTSATTPDLTRFSFMSHVRKFNTAGMTDLDATSPDRLSATVSLRTGNPGTQAPETTFAHLVSLVGLSGNTQMTFTKDKPVALVSLYSWSFTRIPPASFSTQAILTALGANIGSMRIPDSTLLTVNSASGDSSAADSWVKEKMLSGYTIIRYRTPTGEPTVAMLRSLLTAVKFDVSDFPPSDYGSDLATVDERSGLLDLTFQLAWELGRTSAMADRTISAALARLRQSIHNTTLAKAKDDLDATFVSALQTMSNLPSTITTTSLRQQQTISFYPQRWGSAPLGVSTRETLSFQSNPVKQQYRSNLQGVISNYASAAPPPTLSSAPTSTTRDLLADNDAPKIFDETQPAESSDYATVFQWILDRWSLHAIPFPNLIPDPTFVPKESIRTFFVDANWFKVFVDGVLSLSEHFDETDDVREAIKASLSSYLAAPLEKTGFPPQVPKWGFFIRSEFVTKFPNLKISAPFGDDSKVGKQAEILRLETLDTDLMLALFDREPADFSKSGITITPPEHQLSSMFGTVDGIDAKGILTIRWKNVNPVKTAPRSSTLPPSTFNLTDGSAAVYDKNCQAILPANFAAMAVKYAALPQNYNNAQTVASQLVAMVPGLSLLAPTIGLHSARASAASLSTSKSRPNALPSTSQQPLLTVPPPQSNTPVTLPSYPAPVQPMVAAIARTDVLDEADKDVVDQFFKLGLGSLSIAPPTQSSPTRNQWVSGSISQGNQSLLSTPIYNLRYPSASNPVSYPTPQTYQTGLVSLYPLSLGFTTDVHIPMVSLATSSAILTSVTLSFPVGSDPRGHGQYFFAPFPTNVAKAPVRNASGEWPLQPNHTGSKQSGAVLPSVRSVGVGRRWNVRTSMESGGILDVTLVANAGDPTAKTAAAGIAGWDINVYRDLGIVIEGVQLTCNESWGGPTYNGVGANKTDIKIQVQENYVNGTVKSQTMVTVYSVDVTQPGITIPPRGSRPSLPVSA